MGKIYSPTAPSSAINSYGKPAPLLMSNDSTEVEQTIRASNHMNEFKNFLENYVRKIIQYDLAFMGMAVYHDAPPNSRQTRNFHTGFVQLMLDNTQQPGIYTDNKSVLYFDIEKGVRLHPVYAMTRRHQGPGTTLLENPGKKHELLHIRLLAEKNRFNSQLYAEFTLLKTHSPITELNKHSALRIEPLLKEKLHELLHKESQQQSRASTLTLREKEILTCINRGYSNKQIGCQLTISEFTVKNHVRRIQKKLKADNRAHALAIALSEGVVLDDKIF